jgi:WD40 repeat protein
MAKIGHCNKVCSIKTMEDHYTFASAGWDQNLITWDLRKKDAIGQVLAVKVAGDSMDVRMGKLIVG